MAFKALPLSGDTVFPPNYDMELTSSTPSPAKGISLEEERYVRAFRGWPPSGYKELRPRAVQ